jgi:myo-inositol-1(or 4)-monophosphatase
LVRAAGGVVTDIAGNAWSSHSGSVLAGDARCHAQILDILRDLGDPGDY